MDDKFGEIVLAGGNDGSLTVYKFEGGKLSAKLWDIACDAAPRSLDLFNGKILIGTKNGSIAHMEMSDSKPADPVTVMTSHCDGEVWAQTVACFDGKMRLITASDDNRILAYDPLERKVLCEGKVAEASKKKGKKGGFKGGAST